MEAFSNKHVRVRKEHCFGSASCGVFADTPKRYWCRHFELGFSKFQSCAHENQLRLSVLPRPSLTHWERSKNNSHKSRRKSQILNIGIFTFFIDKTFFEIYQLYIVFNIRYVPSPPCRYVWFCVRTNVPELTHFIRPIGPFRWNTSSNYQCPWDSMTVQCNLGGPLYDDEVFLWRGGDVHSNVRRLFLRTNPPWEGLSNGDSISAIGQ